MFAPAAVLLQHYLTATSALLQSYFNRTSTVFGLFSFMTNAGSNHIMDAMQHFFLFLPLRDYMYIYIYIHYVAVLLPMATRVLLLADY